MGKFLKDLLNEFDIEFFPGCISHRPDQTITFINARYFDQPGRKLIEIEKQL